MSVSFSYFTREDITSDLLATIRSEAESLNNTREWVSTEALIFFDMDEYESKAFGNSKFFPGGIGNETDGVPDVQFIIDALCDWSKRFDISWQITAEEADVGIIEHGKPDDAVQGFVKSLSDAELWQF